MTKRSAAILTALLLAGCTRSAGPAVPAGYPSAYADTITAADREGELNIWSAIDQHKAAGLVAEFQRRYPHVHVHYTELPAQKLYQRFVAAAGKGGPTVDFLWSSAMDLQIKLVNDGYAQPYVSPERGALPHWANWKDQAWGTTAEPIVFLYNRKLISDAAVPRGHVALLQYLEGHPAGRSAGVATYDLRNSAVGYLYLSQDQQATHDIWRLVRAMSGGNQKLFANAEEIVADLTAGKSAIAYNIVGSYALGQTERNPDLGMILPRDYTLLMSRIAVIPAAAAHPSAARLFLDFLLSRSGQAHLVRHDMPSVRPDVPAPAGLNPNGVPLRAIRVGPALLVNQDQLTRRYFLRRWQASIDSAS